ncbi:hypothetical protein BVRB_4g085040 [Beta vulgaris subsp. vulgaris]|nr:hypothetical protein BVRB_4g085040 [Beta vulgaris subsp. vulgaris]
MHGRAKSGLFMRARQKHPWLLIAGCIVKHRSARACGF